MKKTIFALSIAALLAAQPASAQEQSIGGGIGIEAILGALGAAIAALLVSVGGDGDDEPVSA